MYPPMSAPVAVAICTYNRPLLLDRLIVAVVAIAAAELPDQRVPVVVVDDSREGSARSVVESSPHAETLRYVHTASGDISVEHWGRRQLAYPIKRRESGYYAIAHFTLDDVKVLPEFERALKLDEGVLRYLISLHEHELGAPPMTEEQLAARKKDDDDDEDEE